MGTEVQTSPMMGKSRCQKGATMSKVTHQSEVEEIHRVTPSESSIMDLSAFMQLPMELCDYIIKFWVSKVWIPASIFLNMNLRNLRDPLIHARSLTLVNKQLRRQWTPVQCRTLGPLRVDKHLDPAVLGFLNQAKHRKSTMALSIYFDTGFERTAWAYGQLHRNFGKLTRIYGQAENLRVLAVHPKNIVDFEFQRRYQGLISSLPNLQTLVVPTRQNISNASSGSSQHSPVGAVARVRHNTTSNLGTLFLRYFGCVNTARHFMHRAGYALDSITLFGYEESPPGWWRPLSALGWSASIDSREVNLHRFEGSEILDLRLSENVVSLSICNPIDNDDELESDVATFFQNFIKQKKEGGNKDLNQLHLISTLSDVKKGSWISKSLLYDIVQNMENLWALSIHQNDLLSFTISDLKSDHWPNLKLFSIREPPALIYTDIEMIASACPYIEGFGLDMPHFGLLYDVKHYSKAHRRMFTDDGIEFWEALSSVNLKTLLVFVGRSKKVWNFDEMQRHAVLFEYALLDFLSPLEDTSLETVHFVLRDLGYPRYREEMYPREEVVWSFRVNFESFTESDCSKNSSEVTLQQFTHDEMTEDELDVFKVLSGHQELFFEQIEHKKLGHLY